MFLTMAVTSAVLMATYVEHNRRIRAVVAAQASELLQIIQLTQTRIAPMSTREEALEAYMKALRDAGLSSITLAAPSGEVVASTTPGQVGKIIKFKKRRASLDKGPIKISAELHDMDLDSGVEQKTYLIEFPIVQGDKVIGYAQVKGELDLVEEVLRRSYVIRLAWIVGVMLAGLLVLVYLSFRFTKPVDTVLSGAQQIAQGNLNVALPVTSGDEVGRLATTFNRMVERLREHRQLQERLNEAEKTSLLGRFAATLAHEVRNSLNYINLSIDQTRARYAQGDSEAAAELHRNLSNAKEEILRLNRLVSDVLAAGQTGPARMAPCDLSSVVKEAVSLVEKQARPQGITTRVSLPHGLPVVHADGAQLKTCFLNVLTNAIQALPRGGYIEVHADRVPADDGAEKVQIRFADTGPGIPPEMREKIFAPFFSTKPTGFGLGLAITKRIVEDHGGRTYVADSTAGGGAVIVIELPLKRPPDATSSS